MFEVVGRFWNEESFEVVSDNKEFYVLNGDSWNGEVFTNCFKVLDKDGYEIDDTAEEKTFKPIYKEVDEDQFEIIGYEKM